MVRTALPYLAEHWRLGAEGADVRAEIITVTQTGWYHNRQPELELERTVHQKNEAEFYSTTWLISPLIMIPRYQPGKIVPAKVDANRQAATVSGSYQQTPGI